jgi:hypothetical protein
MAIQFQDIESKVTAACRSLAGLLATHWGWGLRTLLGCLIFMFLSMCTAAAVVWGILHARHRSGVHRLQKPPQRKPKETSSPSDVCRPAVSGAAHAIRPRAPRHDWPGARRSHQIHLRLTSKKDTRGVIGSEHEMIEEYLRASAEEVRQRGTALVGFEAIALIDRNPRQILSLSCQFVVSMCEFLFRLEKFDAYL